MGDSRSPLRFGEFELNQEAGELRRDGSRIRLQEQPLQILRILIERPGEIVSREELQKRIWPSDTFVDFDHGINNAIKRLREALCDTAETPKFIETVPRRGYRFLARIDGRGSLIRSLAVLPLENLSNDPEQEFFADGLTEALITTLGKIGDLRVVSRTSAMQYKGVRRPLREIARELGVNTIVEGSVLRVGGRVRITAQLIDTPEESHLWAESYERDMRDILALQAEIAQAIAREIHIKLTPQEQAHLDQVHTVDPDAYESYLKGRYRWNKRSGDSLSKGAQCFHEAIQKDPTYAAAYAGLADCASSGGWFGYLSPEDGFGKGRDLAREALAIDRSLGEAHASLAWALTHYDYDFVTAEREYERSIELNPRYATAHHWFGMLLLALGRMDESITEFKRSLRLDPLVPVTNLALAFSYFFGRRLDEAFEQCNRTIDLEPGFIPSCYVLGLILMFKNDPESALTAFKKGVEISSGGTTYLGGLGWGYAAAGKKDEARQVLAQLCQLQEQKYVMPTHMALIHIELNEKEQALRWLEEAFAERCAWMVYTNTDPRYDRMRSEPGFQDLLRRMKFTT